MRVSSMPARYGAKWTIMLCRLQNPDEKCGHEYDGDRAAYESEPESTEYVSPVVHENCPLVSANPVKPRYGCEVTAPVNVIILGSSLFRMIPSTSIVSTVGVVRAAPE